MELDCISDEFLSNSKLDIAFSRIRLSSLLNIGHPLFIMSPIVFGHKSSESWTPSLSMSGQPLADLLPKILGQSSSSS